MFITSDYNHFMYRVLFKYKFLHIFLTYVGNSSSTPSSQNDNIPAPSVSSETRNRKWTSPVWQHYKLFDASLFPDGIARAICKYCDGGPTLAYSGNGTSNFKRHTETCPKRPLLGVAHLTSDGSFIKKMDPLVYKERVALAVIRHAFPFSYAEYDGNRWLHEGLNESYKPISRNTLRNYCMKIHKREKQILKESLSNLPGKICLTTDMWTAFVGMGYISLTAHYIDSEWNLHSKILNFCHLEPPHDAPSLHDSIYAKLKEWDIRSKIFTITLDNARCNDNMQDLLMNSLSLHSPILCDGEYFHVRCAAHILNLIVQDGLKVIDSGVRKLRMVVAHIVGSERRLIKFKGNASALGVDTSKKLCLDCVTRWNSTYNMLERAMIYRNVFPTMRGPEMKKFDPHFPEPPSEAEWIRIVKIVELLKPFDHITTLISGRKYPTANLYFKSVWKIQYLLTRYAKCNDTHLKDMADLMRIKFDKYWENYSMILSFAAILDPRYKLPFIKYCFHKLDPESAELKTKVVKDKFYKLYEEYVKYSPHVLKETSVQMIPDELPGFANFDGGAVIGGLSYLDTYLDDARLDHTLNIDVLKWWKENESKYLVLAEMAIDILTIQINTVASESAFRMESRVLMKWRTTLLLITVDALCGHGPPARQGNLWTCASLKATLGGVTDVFDQIALDRLVSSR
uniref:Ac-like transposase THELMA13 n=1 Tax=Silene latifolia TaxID=37657 RepID=Q6Y8E6_SILLA|nr:Ac-like transposase THELMA13 [Silene latifolia]